MCVVRFVPLFHMDLFPNKYCWSSKGEIHLKNMNPHQWIPWCFAEVVNKVGAVAMPTNFWGSGASLDEPACLWYEVEKGLRAVYIYVKIPNYVSFDYGGFYLLRVSSFIFNASHHMIVMMLVITQRVVGKLVERTFPHDPSPVCWMPKSLQPTSKCKKRRDNPCQPHY